MGMRLLIPNVITSEEAKSILENPAPGLQMHDRSNDIPAVLKIRKAIESALGEINWEKPSYLSLELNHISSSEDIAHDWHVDTGGAYGSKGHMTWCDYGTTVLLNGEETSGYLEYKDGTKILPKEHFCSLAIHSSDIEHRVINKGTREVILCFVQRKL